MNWLDQAISEFSPSWGLRRVNARRALELAGRAYEAARRDHRTTSWHTSGASANAEVACSEEIVRNRSRDLIRNNGYALQIVETFADHVIGTGIVSAPKGLKGRNLARVNDTYARWVDACDWDGDQDLHGLMWSALKGMGESGASLIRLRRVQFDASTKIVPLRLQVIEPDFIDPLKNGTTLQGGIIDRGIEYDSNGIKVALWLYDHHPGDVAQFRSRFLQSSRVPLSECIYLYDKLRPGQDRGMPILAPAIMTLQDLRGYFQSELVRKRIAACMVGVITTNDENANVGIPQGAGKPMYGPQSQKFEPGMWTRLLPGEDVTFNTVPADGQIDAMATIYLREASAAAGVMYEHTTGDFSRVNYSSWRAGSHGFQRRIERRQWNVAIHKCSKPIHARFNEAGLAAQLLPVSVPDWRHTPPGFISVDPYKDAQADLANLRMGKVTLSQLVEKNGYDYLAFLQQVAEDLDAADQALAHLGKGTMFDGDPRKPVGGMKPTNDAAGNDKAEAEAAPAA